MTTILIIVSIFCVYAMQAYYIIKLHKWRSDILNKKYKKQ